VSKQFDGFVKEGDIYKQKDNQCIVVNKVLHIEGPFEAICINEQLTKRDSGFFSGTRRWWQCLTPIPHFAVSIPESLLVTMEKVELATLPSAKKYPQGEQGGQIQDFRRGFATGISKVEIMQQVEKYTMALG
jgi:hypothetical protein